MKKIVTCKQMKYLDQQTFDRFCLPSLVLMERASLSVSDFIRSQWPDASRERILVVCGSGNNGGDGIAIARLLTLAGYHAVCYLAGSIDKMTEQTAIQYQCAKEYQIPFIEEPDTDQQYTLVIDAIFGVGLSREITGKYHGLLAQMNEMPGIKIAVDIPSGVNRDTGQIMGIAFRADYTITFAYQKQGLCFFPAKHYAGKIIVTDIGIYDREDLIHKYQLESHDIAKIPKRVPCGNKGTFGKILILAGSEGMSGAAYLCASAALNAGAGMVLVHTPECNRIVLQTMLPEAMVSCDFSENEYERLMDWCDCIVIGPGLGTTTIAALHVSQYLTLNEKANKPMIIDADGLNLLSNHPHWLSSIGPHVIITPHVGEMSRLTGKTIAEIKNALIDSAKEYTEKYKAVCVLKDAVSVVTGLSQKPYAEKSGSLNPDAQNTENPDHSEIIQTYLNTETNPGLATAGSGDVLCGTLAGVIGCYLSEYQGYADEKRYDGSEYIINKRNARKLIELLPEAAALGVLLHSAGGKIASKKYGQRSMKAGDILQGICESLMNEEME